MAIQAWDKTLREQNESLKIQNQIAFQAGKEAGANEVMTIAGVREPNEEDAPYRERPPGGKPWEGYPKPYQPKLAHGEGRGPQQKFHDEYNIPLDKPPWRHINPRGEPIDIEWQKEEYMKDHPQFFSNNKGMTIAGQPEFDQFMQNMRRGGQNPKSGSIKHHPPHIQKLILGIGKRIRA